MASLAGKAPGTTFKDLLHVYDGDDNEGLESSLKTMFDGEGIASPLQISTTNLNISNHNGSTGLQLAGTLVTSSAAEINKLAGLTPGTVAISKFVLVDSNKDISGFRNITATGTIQAANFTATGNTQIGDVFGQDTVAMNATITTNLIFEGTTANEYEVQIAPGDPTADRTLTLPDESGILATQYHVTSQVNSLIDSAPSALNTLNELAAALGDDANFAATVTTSLGAKASKTGSDNIVITKSDAKVQVQESNGASGYLLAQGTSSGLSLTTSTQSPIHLATNSTGPSTDYSIKLDKDSKDVDFAGNVKIKDSGFLQFNGASYITQPTADYLKLRIANGDYFVIHGGASDTEYMRIANDGKATFSGNVEIDGTTEMSWGGAYNDTSMANFKSVNNAGFYIRSYYAGGIGVAMNPITGSSIGGGRLSLASHDYRYYLAGTTGSSAATLTSAGDIALGTGGTGQNAEGTKRLYIKNIDGSIVIGTDNPHSNIHINSSSNLSWIQFNNSSATHGVNTGSKFGINGSHAYIWNYENADIYLGTNNATAVRIHAGGKIEVSSGSIHIDTNNKFLTGRNTYNSDVVPLIGMNSSNWVVVGPNGFGLKSGTGNVIDDGGGNATFAGTLFLQTASPNISMRKVVSGTTTWFNEFKITGADNDTILKTSVFGQDLIFGTADVEKMRLKGANLGIGTDDPQGNLSITASSNPLLTITETTSGTGASGGIAFSNQTESTYRKAGIYFNRTESTANRGYLGFALDANASTANVDADWAGNTKMVVNYDGNVGIGTDSPAMKLHVLGGDETTAKFEDSSGKSVLIDGNSFVASNEAYIKVGAANKLYFQDGSDTNMTISGTGQVGIGTTSPSANLHISANDGLLHIESASVNNSTFIRMAEDGFQGGFIKYDGGNNLFKIGTHDAADSNASNDIDVITLLRDGTGVGIGTTSPTAKLEVSPGNSDLTSDAALGLWIKGNNAGIKIGRHSGNDSAYTHLYTDVVSTDFLVVKNNGGNDGGISTDRIGSLTQNPLNNYIHFNGYDKIFSRLGTTQMTMGAGKVYFESVNVGIGTNSPSSDSLLHLKKDGIYDLTLENGDSANWRSGIKGRGGANGTQTGFALAVGRGTGLECTGAGIFDTYLMTTTDEELHFGTNNTSRMTIDGGTGAVGIGQTAPAYALDVNHIGSGNLRLRGASNKSAGSNTYAYFQTPDSSNEMAMTIKSYTNAYWAIQGMEQGIGWKPIVLNEYGGNVGIQDTSPSSTLSVGGNAEFVTSGHTWKINGYTFGTTSNSDWELLAGGSAKMVIYNAGDIKINNKLGVGGISPDTTLHIEGESVTHSHGKLETALGADIDDSVKDIDHIATRITTDNSAEEMFLDGSSTRLVIPSNTSWFFKVNVVAMQVANGVRTGGYSFEGVIMNDDDTVSMPTDSSGNSVANPTRTFQNEWNSSMTCDLSADDTNKTLKIAIKGMGDRTHWVADIHIVQTKF